MNLIDVDALKKEFQEKCVEECDCCPEATTRDTEVGTKLFVSCGLIDRAPIIDTHTARTEGEYVMLKRYRFKTNSPDLRPVIDLAEIQMPWWCSGYDSDDNAYIICYLPEDADLLTYWPEAFEIESEDADRIVYTDRFPKPEWIGPVKRGYAYEDD